MPERRQPWKTVRVRITAIATLVVAIALTLAAVGLVNTVHHQLIDKVEAEGRARVLAVANKLAAGTPVPDALRGAPPANGPVVVLDPQGRPIGGTAAGLSTGALQLFDSTNPSKSGGSQVSVESPDQGSVTPFDIRFQAVSTNGGLVTVVAASPLTDIEHSISTLKSTLAIGVPLLVVLVALVAWFIVGRALQPVEAITAEVEAITASTIHRRVPEPPTGDEINHLARTMNAMLDRLETASTNQRQFVSDASHELRSPIAAIRTQLEVARNDGPGADWPTVADNVLAEEARLEHLVGGLLLLAAANEQVDVANTVDLDLRTIARNEAARARAVPVACVTDDEPVVVRANAVQLTTVVANLLDNAARFAASEVTITATCSGTAARLIVEDDGPGIPVTDRERVFERFTRLDQSRTRADGGSGLGLAVVKTIVERHRGRVEATDSANGGARFVVDLPAV
jgi:signal transduction histidine kinase